MEELRRLAVKTGLVPMRSAALRLVEEGQIAMSELPLMISLGRLAES